MDPDHPLHAVPLPSSSSPSPSKLLSWSVAIGDRVRKGTSLCSYTHDLSGVSPDSEGKLHLKSTLVGVVKELMVQSGNIIQPGTPVVVLEEKCDHSIVVFDMCADCGLNLRRHPNTRGVLSQPVAASVSMIHGIPEIRISQKEAEELGNKDKRRLLESRKLALVVDLDQTLIHTSVDPSIQPGLPDVYGFGLPGHPMIYHCRLRPYARQFLQKVSQFYEMHVFTMGTKDYAASVTHILDPEKRLFCDRIISRAEFFDSHLKALTLKSVFPCGDSMVAIIDDREDVWGPRCPNLVHVKPYIFFANTADINAPPPHPTPPPGTPPTPTSITPHMPPLTQAQAPLPIGSGFPPQQVPFKTRHFCRTNEKFRPPQMATSGSLHQPQAAKGRADLEEAAKREGHTVLESLLLAGQPNHQDSHLHLHQGHVHQLEISHTYAHANKPDNTATEATASSDKPITTSDTAAEVTTSSDTAREVITSSDTAGQATLRSTTTTKDAASVAATETTCGDVVGGGNVNENNNNRTSDVGGKGGRKREGSGSSSSSSSSSSESASEDSSSSSSGIDNTNPFETLGSGEQHESGEGMGEREEGEGEEGEKNGGQTEDQEGNSEEKMDVDPPQSSEDATQQPGRQVSSNEEESAESKHKSERKRRKGKPPEINDPDNFLLHLGDTLKRIHATFYKQHDKMTRNVDLSTATDIPTPDLKQIIPKMRQSVLKGAKILFTGVIPTNMPPERSPEWNTARAFGAVVHDKLLPGLSSSKPKQMLRATTHVIAGKAGTSKFKDAKRIPGMKIVNPRWLWSCAERWKWMDERLFPVEPEKSSEEKGEDTGKGDAHGTGEPLKRPKLQDEDEERELTERTGELIGDRTGTQMESFGLQQSEMEEKDDNSDNEVAVYTEQKLKEFERHLSTESRLSVSDEELEKMDAEVDAELIESSSSSDEHTEQLGTFISPDKGEEDEVSYEKFTGDDVFSGQLVNRKRKLADIEDSSSSNNSPNTSVLNVESVEQSDDSDVDESGDELAVLLGGNEDSDSESD